MPTARMVPSGLKTGGQATSTVRGLEIWDPLAGLDRPKGRPGPITASRQQFPVGAKTDGGLLVFGFPRAISRPVDRLSSQESLCRVFGEGSKLSIPAKIKPDELAVGADRPHKLQIVGGTDLHRLSEFRTARFVVVVGPADSEDVPWDYWPPSRAQDALSRVIWAVDCAAGCRRRSYIWTCSGDSTVFCTLAKSEPAPKGPDFTADRRTLASVKAARTTASEPLRRDFHVFGR